MAFPNAPQTAEISWGLAQMMMCMSVVAPIDTSLEKVAGYLQGNGLECYGGHSAPT